MGHQKQSAVYYGGAVSWVLLHSWTWGNDGAAEIIRFVLWWSRAVSQVLLRSWSKLSFPNSSI
jgi:hypothetical protein